MVSSNFKCFFFIFDLFFLFRISENWLGREVSLIHEGGNAAMVVTLFSLGLARLRFQIPEQIIIFDPKIKVLHFIFVSMISSLKHLVMFILG